jgi:ATP-dependent DNA helicase RecG
VREAGQNELIQMAQASGRLVFGQKPVAGATLADLDERRLADYFSRVAPSERLPEGEEWTHLLVNLELMTKSNEVVTPTIDGMLLFGRNPKKFLPQSGVRAIYFEGDGRDYAAKADEDLKGPLVPLLDQKGVVLENGLVEQALDFIRRNTSVVSELNGGRREDRPDYPSEVLREVVVNALVHRDYSIVGTDVSMEIFSDRLEVGSPGRLPNTATLDAVKTGFRYARNQTLVNFMRDYRYVDFRGMGIRQKIIPGMLAHSGREPGFVASEWEFRVCLFRR